MEMVGDYFCHTLVLPSQHPPYISVHSPCVFSSKGSSVPAYPSLRCNIEMGYKLYPYLHSPSSSPHPLHPPPHALSPQTYHTLTLVSRDSLALLTIHMERIIMEKMTKLQDTTRIQVHY